MKRTHVVLVTIGTGNVITADPVVRVEPEDKIVFVLINDDGVDHYVWIDPAEICQRQDKGLGVFTNPLSTGKRWKKVDVGGEPDFLRHEIRKKVDFGAAGQIPYTTYKYTIRSGVGSHSDPMPAVLDPDIDVVMP